MQNSKIYVAGHRGMVGSALIRKLCKQKQVTLVTRDRKQLDLVNQSAVNDFFKKEKIDQVYMAAAKVGGIYANNTFPAQFIYENIMIQTNVINAAFLNGVKKLLFLGSSCIYPKNAKQPINEEELLTGTLEETNEPYAIAKISGIKLCESYNRQYSESHGVDYRSVMPSNLYGAGDNYHPENSHVIPALIQRFHDAKINNKPSVKIWGTGRPKREFLFVDDMASASIHVMNISREKYDKHSKPRCSHINIGSGIEISIAKLAETIKEIVGYKGKIEFDKTMPDGTARKLMNSYRLNSLGWLPKINMKDGLFLAYEDFLKTTWGK